jgi:TolB-like protein/class 3 adenylate cyclase/Flp pilus assembly protein TadD
MSANAEQRKLAAIMFTDMVGYSALSQRDDKLALELLEEHREILRKLFPEFNGTEIKTIGDAFLVEFNSALEAAQCAVEIQRSLAKRNHDVTSDRRIEIKIGIHIGDVVHRGGDVYGDGVNIASRIEPLAGAGGICVSMDVERQIRNAVETRFEKLAPTELKNISLQMDLFRIVLPWERQKPDVRGQKSEVRTGRVIVARSKWVWAAAVILAVIAGGWLTFQTLRPETRPVGEAVSFPPKQDGKLTASPTTETGLAGARPSISEKSIAVLPFENLSDDKSNAYFAEGIQDEILTRLSKIAALKVISRTSTQKYKSAPDNLREIGQQLGVANLLEGSVQKAGNAVHINVQLIKAATDDHLWAESYDRKIDDIFGVEKEVAQSIASALNAKLSGAEEQLLAQKPTDNPAAYEAYLRGKALLWGGNEDDVRGAIQSYEEAVRLDPQFALAWAGLTSARSIGFYYMDSTPAGRAAAEQSLAKAEALQPQLLETQVARANFGYFVLGDNEHVRDVLQQLHLIWPNSAEVLQLLAFTYQRLGEWQKAIDAFDQVIVLNPRNLQVRKFAAYTRCDVRDWPSAQRIVDEALRIWPADLNLLAIKAQIFQANGQLDEAQLIVDKLKPDRLDYDAVGAVWYQAKLQRKPATALKVFEPLARRTDSLKEWVRDAQILGDLQQLSGDTVAARATFSTVRDTADAGLREQPDNVRFLSLLSLASAGLGERDNAVQAIDKAIVLHTNDARTQPMNQESKARILAHFGDKDGALVILPHLLKISYEGGLFGPPLTPALLRLDPDWDNLRGDPRFEALVQKVVAPTK